jgi:hypothetical protein
MICFLSWLTCQCECTFELEEDEAGSAVAKHQDLSPFLLRCECKAVVDPNSYKTNILARRNIEQYRTWSGPSRVNNKQLTTMDIVAEYMGHSKS